MSFPYLTHGLKELLHKCNVLCEELGHTTRTEDRDILYYII